MTNEKINLKQTQEAVISSYLSYYSPYTKGYNDCLSKLEANLGSKAKTINPFYKTDSQSHAVSLAGYVIATEDKLIVAYHGTTNTSEAWNDLKSSPKSFKLNEATEITGHSGFVDEFLMSNESRLSAIHAIKNAFPDNKYDNITYTGHSLGGALATHAAMHDMVNGNNSTKVITFGSPGSLSEQGSQKYKELDLEKNTLHVQLEHDPISACVSGEAKLIGKTIIIPHDHYRHSLDDGYDRLLDTKLSSLEDIEKSYELKKSPSKAGDFTVSSYSKTVTSSMMSGIFNRLMNSFPNLGIYQASTIEPPLASPNHLDRSRPHSV